MALELRQAGLGYREIAIVLTNKGFQCKFTTAYKDVIKALDELKDKTMEEADKLRTLELTRLDTMLKSIWSKVVKGEVASIDRALRISERRSKLLGIDAPQEIKAEVDMKTVTVKFKAPKDADI